MRALRWREIIKSSLPRVVLTVPEWQEQESFNSTWMTRTGVF